MSRIFNKTKIIIEVIAILFHYHFWTPYVEETEKFYKENGFHIFQRIGKYKGEFQTFNPPLKWDDFREKDIIFRIIEARIGAVNITFGFGKKVIFDHIGFLVTKQELNIICENAKKMKWAVDRGERRTFIITPYKFRIELQTNTDVVDTISDHIKIKELVLQTQAKGLDKDLSILFNHNLDNIKSFIGDTVTIKNAVIQGLLMSHLVDPNGVEISAP